MSGNSSKSIILCPRPNNQGGVANYYKAIRPYLRNDVSFVYRGLKKGRFWFNRLLSDYINFLKTIRKDLKITAIINSSLGHKGFFRDGFYLIISPKKASFIVFFRGWNPNFQRRIDRSFLLKYWLKKTFLKADHIIVLSSKFKENLIGWGYTKEITVETTLVDEILLKGFTFNEKKISGKNILYLSFLSKNKGIMEALDAFNIVESKVANLVFQIAGDGPAIEDVKKKIKKNKIDNANILGYVTGEKKAETFKNADLFLFPSYHEGMPNAVLEAMAFGLPVITTRVGGLPDFFEDGKMGLFLDNHDPAHIAEKIQYLLDRPGMMQQMSEYNYHYAKERFYAGKVAKRLEVIIDTVANS